MSKGFVMVSKDKLESWRWRGNPNKCYVFWCLLFKANFKPEGFEKIVVERGQLVFSYDKLSAELGVPLQTLRTTLRDLTDTGDITIKPTRRWSLLTICEYDSWQKGVTQSNTIENTIVDTIKDTLNGINQINKEDNIKNYNNTYNPKHVDGESGVSLEEFNELKKAFDSLSEENKKLREEKSEKKKKTIFSPPTVDEVSAFIFEKGYHFNAERFHSYYESNGWMVGRNKMKDWKAACRTWESNKKEESTSLFPQQDQETQENKKIEWE